MGKYQEFQQKYNQELIEEWNKYTDSGRAKWLTSMINTASNVYQVESLIDEVLAIIKLCKESEKVKYI